jgi:hypothetical protein
MPSIFYMDYELGVDSGGVSTNTPLGWWSVTFNNGTGNAPTADDAITGATSGHHGHLTVVGALTGGSWAGNDAAGTLYFYGMDDLLHNGEQIDWHDGHAHTTAAAVYNPWKTITSGATAARIAPGDTIRIAKSPVPTSIGDATWTNLSKTVTLATAGLTLPICMCEANWTAVHAVDCAASATDWKEGAAKVKITEDAAGNAGEIQAWFATGALDLSGYQAISFWIKNEVAIADATRWVINLYTSVDASGVAAHSFVIPAIPSTGRWLPLTISAGGNMTNGINSIAVVNGAAVPTASKYIYLDNIIACTTNGLNLQSLISKNQLEQSSTASVNASEGWYGIQSINGVTILLDNDTNTIQTAGRGYSTTGVSPEAVATYKRETIKTALAAAWAGIVQEVQENGTALLLESYEGGYDISTNGQTGETIFDGLNCQGYGIEIPHNYNYFNHIGGVRYAGVFDITTTTVAYNTIKSSNVNNCLYYGVQVAGCLNVVEVINGNNNGRSGVNVNGYASANKISIINANNHQTNNYGGVSVSGTMVCANIILTARCNNNVDRGFYMGAAYDTVVMILSTAWNGTQSIFSNSGNTYITNANLSEATSFSTASLSSDSKLYITNQSGTFTGSYIYSDGGTINSQTVTRHTASGVAWKFSPTSTRGSYYKLSIPIARIACTGGKAITFKAWMKKDHATNIACWLRVQGGQDSGIPTDVTVTKADDTDWEELTLPAFTPTNACVIEVLAEAWYVAGVSYAYVDDCSVSEA